MNHTTHASGALSRRDFIVRTSAAILGAGMGGALMAAQPGAARRQVVVGAMPWVYAAPLPTRDITPFLPEIFADYEYAGIDHIELLHNVLLSDATISRIGELAAKHRVKVLGCEFGAQMFNRDLHGKILEEAERTIAGLARLGGRTI